MYRPWTTRTVGIEIEVLWASGTGSSIMHGGLLRRGMNALGISVNPRDAGYYRSNGLTWDIKTDSSCGFEIASPALRLDDNMENADLKGVLGVLRRRKAQVNERCGLHVHVNATDLSWRQVQQLVALWARYEPFFFETFLPPDRRLNSYCPPIRDREWRPAGSTLSQWDATQRWLAMADEDNARRTVNTLGRSSLNVLNWWLNGRVEFRLHPGTLSYDKIRMWAALCAAVVHRVAPDNPMRPVSTTINQPKPELGFSAEYVFSVLGLLPNARIAEVPDESRKLLAFAKERKAAWATGPRSGYMAVGSHTYTEV